MKTQIQPWKIRSGPIRFCQLLWVISGVWGRVMTQPSPIPPNPLHAPSPPGPCNAVFLRGPHPHPPSPPLLFEPFRGCCPSQDLGTPTESGTDRCSVSGGGMGREEMGLISCYQGSCRLCPPQQTINPRFSKEREQRHEIFFTIF